MKKIINGKKYDTETAKEIASRTRRDSYGVHSCALYKKRTGEYFLGSNSAEKDLKAFVEEDWCESEGRKYAITHPLWSSFYIIPVTSEQARDWVAVNCDGETYEAEFGEVEE